MNKDDDVLIVQAGSVDISNLKTDKQTAQNVEYFKQQTLNSARNLFAAVTDAVGAHADWDVGMLAHEG